MKKNIKLVKGIRFEEERALKIRTPSLFTLYKIIINSWTHSKIRKKVKWLSHTLQYLGSYMITKKRNLLSNGKNIKVSGLSVYAL